MNCRTFHRNLEDYLQGDLDFAGRFGVERHAQQCFDCGRTLAEAQKLSEAMRRVTRVRAPKGFEESVMRRIQAARIRRRPWVFDRFWLFGWEGLTWRRVAFAGSLAALLVVSAVVSYQILSRRNTSSGLASTHAPVEEDNAPRQNRAEPSPGEAVPVSAGTQGAVRLGPGHFDSERGWVAETAEPVDGEFIELPAPGAPEMTVRLPKSIRVMHAPPPEEYFIRHVSH
jgi:anti-sigma factor RsiW